MENNCTNEKSYYSPGKKIISIILSLIIALGTFVTMTFGNLFLSDYIDFKSAITAQAALPDVMFYRYGELVGLHKSDYTNEAKIQYKLGESGEWTDYSVPFTIPAHETTKVYARAGENGSITYQSLSTTNKAIGVYSEENTDFDFSYNNINFGYTRIYNSADRKWFTSINSKAKLWNELMTVKLPDGTEYYLVRTGENTYTDELYGYKLVKEETEYVFEAEDYTYCFNEKYSSVEFPLHSIEDSAGNKLEINHEADLINNVISDASGRSFSMWDEYGAGYINIITDPNGNDIEYVSDLYDFDNYTKVTDQAGVVIGQYNYTGTYGQYLLVRSMDKTIDYYENGRLKKITYDNGSYVNYTYDDANMTYTTLTSGGEGTKTVYNDAFMPVEYTDEYGNVTTYTYDDHYRLLTEKTDDATTAYTYDSNGNILSGETGNAEEDTYYTYDSSGRIVREQSGSSYTYYTYDSNGNVLVNATLKEDYSGDIPELYDSSLTCFDTVSYTYDSKGRVSKETDSTGGSTSYEYDAVGNVTKETASVTENGETKTTVTTYTYDSMGNLLTSQCDKETSSYINDKAGRTLLANENGECTRTLYDELGRVVQEIAPEDYDASKDGLPQADTYADSNVGQRYVYNDKNQLTKEINRLNVTTDYTYYETGEKKTEAFDIYRFEYNQKGSPTKIFVGGENTLAYTYDENNNLTKEEYANGDVIRYAYDEKGNLTAQYRDDSTSPYVAYVYNAENELTQKVNYDSGLKTVYGENDKVDVYKTSDDTLVQSYTETEVKANEETGESAYTTITGSNFGADYSKVIKDKSITYEIGDNYAAYICETDDDGKILSDSLWLNPTAKVLYSKYSYGDYGITLKDIDSYANIALKTLCKYDDDGKVIEYGYDFFDDSMYYDSNNQLTRMNGGFMGFTSTYTYDSRGNILSKNKYDYTEEENITLTPKETKEFTYSNSGWKDKIVKINDDPLTYDANGNVLTYAGKTYEWENGRNLKKITDGDNTYSYTYDENGIRTSKTINGVTTYYNTKDGVILSQTDGTNTMYFQYDINGIPFGFTYNGKQYYYMTNPFGDVISIFDDYRNEIAQYEYDESGQIILMRGMHDKEKEQELQIAQANPIRYRGYYYDTETDYYYLQSRYYDPAISRFINADDTDYLDKDIKTGLNLFAYCGNDPVNNCDPTGTSKKPKTFFSGFGIQLEFSFSVKGVGSVVIGLEIVWFTSSKVKIGWKNREVPYLYWFMGGAWAKSSAENWLNSRIKRIIKSGVGKILTNPSTFSASLSLFIIKGFKNNKNGYKKFLKAADYLGAFHSSGASVFNFKGYKSWSNNCNVYGIGYDCSKFGLNVLEKTYYRYVPGYNKLASSFSSLFSKAKSKINKYF